jgi:hypothetical protein
MHSLETGRPPTATFPMVQDTPLPTSAGLSGWLFSATDQKRLLWADTTKADTFRGVGLRRIRVHLVFRCDVVILDLPGCDPLCVLRPADLSLLIFCSH